MPIAKVLVVEDERIVALHLRQQLTRLAYDVVAVAHSGEQALLQVAAHHPDIVLMDIHIEGKVDGIDTAQEIRAGFRIPVIFLSAHSEEATLQRARASQPFGYLLKPFSERELHATIQMSLERRAVETALWESEERLRLALDAAEMGSWELDPETGCLLPAGQAERILGFPEEVFSRSWDDFLALVHPDDRSSVIGMFDCVMQDRGLCQAEFRSGQDGAKTRWLKVQGRVFKVGEARRVIGVVQDVTDRRAVEVRLRQAATVFEAMQDGIVIFDANLKIITVNQGFSIMSGYGEEELAGRELYLLSGRTNETDIRRNVIEATLLHAGFWQGEVRAVRKNGDVFPLQVKVAAVMDTAGKLTHYIAICSDVSAIRQAETDLKYLAHYDPLTDLPNRLLAMDRLEHAMDRCERGRQHIGLLFIDLDHFKNINDTLGHSVGDDLLKQVAQRMRRAVRAEDTVARLGGDEFMVIVENVEHVEDIADIARKVVALVATPIAVSGNDLCISASVGISLFPEDGTSRETLIRAADTAMYAAKDLGRSRYAFYTNEMTSNAVDYMRLKQDLRRGSEQGELRLFFQPQLALSDGALTGLEALIRWQHPQKGLLGADHIIPIAEKSGLIVDIGEWVVREACRQISRWTSLGLMPPRLAINVSPQQIRHGNLVAAVADALRETGVSPDQLEIEITESLLQDEGGCILTLRALKEMGVTLAIDDFGTGYSCLSSLKHLPIQRLKIDRSFVQDIPDDRDNAAITEAIIAMAHRLGLAVIAEGVETVRQEGFLRSHGCDDVQGRLHGMPMPALAIEEMVDRGKRLGRSH
ncbi:EAL domain-containing protein [Telmatospirillum sp.]|uniref:two-component system response regulator n=1 Tax=Telmatospirillum sp. TaxID=2079197 RepID=UPI00284C43E3|nr:EAL domain-containing protein [Telmatospirillum sp.]MDR3435819.1 EAL domain-containing protein [Telmatospirillum sp.]